MVAKNDITGDKIQTRPTTKEYSDNYDKIFKKERPCCGGSTSCTAPCVAQEEVENQKEEKTNDREIQESK